MAANGRILNLRYEPWILPYGEAQERRETVYKGRAGAAAWSPDVLIELMSAANSSITEYAVVLDAKYTRKIQEHHWDDTTKYLQIRSTAARQQIVKQMWLVYPDTEGGITFRDSSVAWTTDGPDCPRGEVLEGVLGLVPPDRLPAEATHEAGWLVTPAATVTAFVSGLLAYLELPCQRCAAET